MLDAGLNGDALVASAKLEGGVVLDARSHVHLNVLRSGIFEAVHADDDGVAAGVQVSEDIFPCVVGLADGADPGFFAGQGHSGCSDDGAGRVSHFSVNAAAVYLCQQHGADGDHGDGCCQARVTRKHGASNKWLSCNA